jgi:hypothetical protein
VGADHEQTAASKEFQLMRDPTNEEMKTFLATQTCGEDMGDDITIAIYWFATYWHGGQTSNLYSVLSTSPYEPSRMGRLEGESDTVQYLFDGLEAEFKTRTDHVRRGPEEPVGYSPDGKRIVYPDAIDPVRGGSLT